MTTTSRVSNAELVERIDALAKLISNTARESGPAWDGWRHDIEMKLAEISHDLQSLAQTVEQAWAKEVLADHCPYRDDIRKAANGVAKMSDLEKTVLDIRLTLARAGFIGGAGGGLVVSTISGIILAIGKAVGWW